MGPAREGRGRKEEEWGVNGEEKWGGRLGFGREGGRPGGRREGRRERRHYLEFLQLVLKQVLDMVLVLTFL